MRCCGNLVLLLLQHDVGVLCLVLCCGVIVFVTISLHILMMYCLFFVLRSGKRRRFGVYQVICDENLVCGACCGNFIFSLLK